MKTITYSLLFSLCLSLFSCAFNMDYPEKIKGEGEVITEQIVLDSFKDLELKRGWEVTLQPASSNYMVVEANENLFEVLEHENISGKLVIGSSKQIASADAKQITLYFTEKLESLKVSSGTEVSSPERLNFDNLILDLSSGCEVTLDLDLRSLDLETSSGSEANLILKLDDLFVDSSSGSSADIEVNAISTKVESSSGSDVFLKGSSGQLEVRTSSGSSVNSKALESEKVTAKASSGSSISVYPLEDLEAETSSGGNVYYYNKPLGSLDLNKSKSGGVIKLK
ncbi:DUF2807 domain-containing protein [Psychroflexus sp. CAK57W]|uniref:GIN domain-containing protein n=1 Tax=Psychroflexus curvus TaxID=2873595 RepID=UPI001CCD009C|nr:DUF2807 domain-containing protein [Psychroflexus curvus]MBZ9628543.1 DUF2807 domain-containing protein [Psychroflexus curvus]MBZ9788009.1 DUF2807 domain-containing protein [Psychroflexus curvus]